METEHILIVGGTSGIGLATARHLLHNGFDVTISGRSNPNEKELSYLPCDVRAESSVRELFNLLQGRGLSGLIYSTGITSPPVQITNFEKSVWEKLSETNVSGALLCLKYAYELLKKSHGRIVIVNSLASRNYSKYSGVEYTMTKSALSGMVRHLAPQFAKDDVLINSVFPGMTMTPMLIKNIPEEILKEAKASVPLNRLAEPKDIARVIQFLISKQNTFITGSGVDVNGGQFLNG